MGMFTLVVILVVLNLGLGYATAVVLGHGPPGLKAAWDALSADGPSLPPDDAEGDPAESPDSGGVPGA